MQNHTYNAIERALGTATARIDGKASVEIGRRKGVFEAPAARVDREEIVAQPPTRGAGGHGISGTPSFSGEAC
jgi:hypothetical protein